jgi:23S rRNA pseudouridine1911/1915/1917 synthase
MACGERVTEKPAPLKLRFVARSSGRLDRLLADELPARVGRPLSRGQVRTLILAGVLRVDGRPEHRPARTVAAGSLLEGEVRLDRLRSRTQETPAALEILHDDSDLLVVNKPPGLLTHPGADPARPSLTSALRSWLEAAGRDTHLGVHQRLDAETSGVIAFGRNAAADAALSRQFAAREVGKTYYALTARPARPPQREWRAEEALALRGSGRSARMVPDSRGAPAVTRLRLQGLFERGLLIEAHPLSGRKHQIRAHLAAAGLPILGDTRYGGATALGSRAVPRVMLHAARLEIRHPRTGRPLKLEVAPPPDFASLLEALRGEAPLSEVPRSRGRRRRPTSPGASGAARPPAAMRGTPGAEPRARRTSRGARS